MSTPSVWVCWSSARSYRSAYPRVVARPADLALTLKVWQTPCQVFACYGLNQSTPSGYNLGSGQAHMTCPTPRLCSQAPFVHGPGDVPLARHLGPASCSPTMPPLSSESTHNAQ